MARSKGTGGLYQRASDGMWVAVLELPNDGVQRRRKVIVRKRQADAITALREARKELERAGDLVTASPTVQQWLELWLERIARPRLKPRTFDDYRSTVNEHLVPTLGRVRLDKLTTAHVRRLHTTMLDKGLSSTTALKAHRILAKALTDAEREGRISRNVATLVDAPRKAVSDRQALTSDQARKLLAASPADERLGWTLALLTGLRQGERLGLTTDALDLERGLLTVSWQLQRLTWEHGCSKPCGRKRAGNCPERQPTAIPAGQEAKQVSGGFWLTRPKSRAGWRQVPLVPEIVAALNGHLAQHSPGLEGLVFSREGGVPIDPAADTRAWREACKRARVPSVPLHAARHTTATLLYELGVPEQTRVAILGHSSATTTAGYTHVSDPLKVDAMDRLGGLLALD
jgi:integrase